MLITFLILLLTGLVKFFNVWLREDSLSQISSDLSTLHDLSGVILMLLVFTHLSTNRIWLIKMTKHLSKGIKWNRKTLQYLIDIGMLITSFLLFITGIIKIPSVLNSNQIFLNNSLLLLIIHDWSGILLTFIIFVHLVLHWKWVVAMTKRIFRKIKFRKTLKYFGLVLLIFSLIISLNFLRINNNREDLDNNAERIQIAGVGWPYYHPDKISSIRPDLFAEGHFSIFDILVYLNEINEINMKYHFDPDLDTYIIDSLNGEKNLWYSAYYDGGWEEESVLRMDHYPYKPKMELRIIRESSTYLQSIYNTYRQEVQRRNANNGTIIIPEVIIRSPHNNLNFQDVEVTAHNLRNDTLQKGVITAIDVIMSLGDQGLITYVLNWYETIGRAVVKNYYVDGINEDLAYARCGFVYEVGDLDFSGPKGNHIHIPSDIRIITSPEYEEWFWICL